MVSVNHVLWTSAWWRGQGCQVACLMPAADELGGLVSRLVPPWPAVVVPAIRDGPHDDPHESAGRPWKPRWGPLPGGAGVARDPAGRGGPPGGWVSPQRSFPGWAGWPVVMAGMIGGA